MNNEGIDKVAQGKRNRRMGGSFERRVRASLIKDNWIVDKFSNNIDLEADKVHVAKSNRFNMRSMGFPDFIAYKYDITRDLFTYQTPYTIKFIECKINGKLSKIEKAKAQWYLRHGYCNKFYVASKELINNRVNIIYKEVKLE